MRVFGMRIVEGPPIRCDITFEPTEITVPTTEIAVASRPDTGISTSPIPVGKTVSRTAKLSISAAYV